MLATNTRFIQNVDTAELMKGVALYNTAFGLMIAIPALMFYRYFRGLVDAYTLDMEQATDRLVPHLMRFTAQRPAP